MDTNIFYAHLRIEIYTILAFLFRNGFIYKIMIFSKYFETYYSTSRNTVLATIYLDMELFVVLQ